MAYTSEIEKLEKRWAENPKGRNFAPLADAYRKAGELDRAIELCKAGLERHPDYVSAHIVYGRCLVDQKQDGAAAAVFRKVLTLDPENVLGLKILAEIAERGHRYDEAVEWLGRLLAVDPMNGDAAEALGRAKGQAAQAAQAAAAQVTGPVPAIQLPAVPAPAAPRSAAAPPRSEPPPPAELLVEHASEPEPPDLNVSAAPHDIETFDGTLDFNAAAHNAARADGIEVQEDVVLEAQNLEVEGLAHTQYESGVFTPPPEAAELEESFPKIDLPLIMPDDVPEAAVAGAAGAGGASAPPPAAVTLSDDDGAADQAALAHAEPVLTETMAELYLRQGHQEDALRVYQALLAQRPGDARLLARVESLTSGGTRAPRRSADTGESLPAFLKRLLAGRPGVVAAPAAPEEAQPPAPSPQPPGESPLASAFSVATNQPEPELDAPGEATHPADDSISLDAVFGEESPRASAASLAAPEPEPTVPAPEPEATPPPRPIPAPGQTGGFSFDQFFSSTVAPAPPPPPAPTAPKPPAPSPKPSPRPAAEDEGELDQFQAWLRGLKS